MTSKTPCRRKLAQFVTYHVLGNVYGDELLPVVDRHRVPDEIGQDGRAARPRPYHFLLVLLVHRGDLLGDVAVGERPSFEGSAHFLSLLGLPADDEPVRTFVIA